jgi:pSer/pThr/pTyr-binding forkhead associated (FHA) protein
MFRKACGSPAGLELQVLDPDGQRISQHRLERPFALLGRNSRNDIRLDAHNVSSRHAYIQLIAGRPFVVDLGSQSGIRWQGEIRRAGWLGPEDTLGIGDFSVRLAPSSAEQLSQALDCPQDVDPLVAGSASRAHSIPTALELAGRNGSARCLSVDRALTLVGRAAACQVRLPVHGVSSFHCALVQTASGLWIVDLLGRDGVTVSGRRVRWARLDDGAQILVGRFPIRVWHERETCAPHAGSYLEALSIREIQSEDGESQLVRRSQIPAAGSVFPLAAYPVAWPPMEWGTLPSAVFNQFAAMQQQMLGQFQQSMLMMAHVFTAMRQEEMELLREVLRRLGGLKREVKGLTAEQKKQAARAMNQSRATPDEPVRDALRDEHRETQADTPHPTAPTDVSSSNGQAKSSAPIEPALVDPSFHAWLSERIDSLDENRQGAWRNLMKFLLG